MAPWSTRSPDPEHAFQNTRPTEAVQNMAMISGLSPVRLPYSLDEGRNESPLRIREQISRQDSLTPESYLE